MGSIVELVWRDKRWRGTGGKLWKNGVVMAVEQLFETRDGRVVPKKSKGVVDACV